MQLTFKSKSSIVNYLALSKLWYLGSTNLLSFHYMYLKLFEKAIFDFIWSNKTEPLKRNTAHFSFNIGSQNIVDISLKLDSLLLKHVKNLICGASAKWTFLAIYRIVLHLRRYIPQLPSYSDYIQPFYRRCLDILKLDYLKILL